METLNNGRTSVDLFTESKANDGNEETKVWNRPTLQEFGGLDSTKASIAGTHADGATAGGLPLLS